MKCFQEREGGTLLKLQKALASRAFWQLIQLRRFKPTR